LFPPHSVRRLWLRLAKDFRQQSNLLAGNGDGRRFSTLRGRGIGPLALAKLFLGRRPQPRLAPLLDASPDGVGLHLVLRQEAAQRVRPEEAFQQLAELLVAPLGRGPAGGEGAVAAWHDRTGEVLLARKGKAAQGNTGSKHVEAIDALEGSPCTGLED